MGAADAVVFKLGYDTRGMKSDLSSAMAAHKAAMAKMRAETQAAISGGGGAHGGGIPGLAGNTRAFGDILDSVTGERGWVMRMNMLSHSLPIAGAAALAIGFEKAYEALEKVQEVNKAVRETLAKPISMTVDLGPEGARAATEQMEKQKEELAASRTYFASLGTTYLEPFLKVSNAIAGTKFEVDAVGESLRKEAALDERKLAINAALTEKITEQTAERTAALHSSERELAIFEAQKTTAEKIAKIEADRTLGADVRRALIKDASQEGADKIEGINAKADQKANEIALAQRLNYIRQQGDEESVKAAYARVDAAKDELSLATTKEARSAARAKLDGAEMEWEVAKKKTAEDEAQRQIALAMANFRGSSEAKNLEQLRLESAELQRQLGLSTTPDEQKKLELLIAQNAERRRAAEIAATKGAIKLADTLTDIGTGSGEAEQLRAAIEKRGHKAAELATLSGLGADKQTIADARKELHAVDQQIAETNRKRQAGNDLAKAGTLELQLEIDHQGKVAAALKTALEYREKINQAHRDENKELADELTKQQGLAVGRQVDQARKDHEDLDKGTLGELASNGQANGSGLARTAKRLEDRAEEERMKGHEATAKHFRERADEIKKRIGPLKNSEKDKAEDDLKGAIDSAQVLKDIKTAVEKFGKVI